jgi:hypothetical protein
MWIPTSPWLLLYTQARVLYASLPWIVVEVDGQGSGRPRHQVLSARLCP